MLQSTVWDKCTKMFARSKFSRDFLSPVFGDAGFSHRFARKMRQSRMLSGLFLRQRSVPKRSAVEEWGGTSGLRPRGGIRLRAEPAPPRPGCCGRTVGEGRSCAAGGGSGIRRKSPLRREGTRIRRCAVRVRRLAGTGARCGPRYLMMRSSWSIVRCSSASVTV